MVLWARREVVGVGVLGLLGVECWHYEVGCHLAGKKKEVVALRWVANWGRKLLTVRLRLRLRFRFRGWERKRGDFALSVWGREGARE